MKHKTKKFIYNIVVILLLITGISWVFSRFIHLGRVEYTDNAQIRQLIVPVNSRVQGFIDKICFDEYRPVRKGDTLALIEDTEFRFRVAQAEADYQNALSGKSAMTTTINTTQNNLAVSDAGLEEARIRMDNAQREYQRYKNLYEKAAVTHQQYDAVKTDYEALKARYELLSRQKQSTALIKQEVDIRKYTAWKNGEFCFNDDTLEEILEELGRWYDVKVIFRSAGKKDIRFSGHLKRYENIQKILGAISESTGIVFHISDRMIIVE